MPDLDHKNQTASARAVVANLRILMRREGLETPGQLARRTGVSQRHCAYILSGERSPSLEIVDKFSAAFTLNSWLLLAQGVAPDIDYTGLKDLVSDYMKSSPAAREYLASVATFERERNEGKVTHPSAPPRNET
jgi:transcriptional regulator with XRE-family HTH domain